MRADSNEVVFSFFPFQFGKKPCVPYPWQINRCVSVARVSCIFLLFHFSSKTTTLCTLPLAENQVCISGTEKLWQTKSFSELGESWHTQMNCSIIIIITITIIIIIIIVIHTIISSNSLWLRWLLLTQLLTINKSNRWWGIGAHCVLFSVYSVFVRIMISFYFINSMIYIMSQVTMNIMITMMIYIIMVSV